MKESLVTGLDGEIFAQDLHKQLKITQFPINLEEILSYLGIEYVEENMGDSEFGGFLHQEGDSYWIIVNANNCYGTRKRFTIAHELGHYWIPTHQGYSYECLSRSINRFLGNNEKEMEANVFASEFLMPKKEFLKDIGKISPAMTNIVALSEKYGTSLTATALRYVKLTQEPCALILSEDKDIKWDWKSNSFKYELLTKLHKDTNAYEMFQTNNDSIREAICSSFWVCHSKDDYVYEDSFYFKGLNQVLTLLTPANIATYEDNEEYDDRDY